MDMHFDIVKGAIIPKQTNEDDYSGEIDPDDDVSALDVSENDLNYNPIDNLISSSFNIQEHRRKTSGFA